MKNKTYLAVLALIAFLFPAVVPAQQFVQQNVSDSGSNVLLLGNFANDGGNDLVTVNAGGSIVCIPNGGGLYTGTPVVSAVASPAVSAFATATLKPGLPDFILLGVAGQIDEYQSNGGCSFSLFNQNGTFNTTPNAILVAGGLRTDGGGPDVLVSTPGYNQVFINTNGILSAPGSDAYGAGSSGAAAGNFGSNFYNVAFQESNNGNQILVFDSPQTGIGSPTGPIIQGTIAGIVNTPSGAVFVASFMGKTLFLTPLTWPVYNTPTLGTPVPFSFPANISSFAQGNFGGGQADGLAIAQGGSITILLDTTGAGAWFEAQTISVASSLTSISAVTLTTTGTYANQTDLIVQRADGQATVLWQQAGAAINASSQSLVFLTPISVPETFSVSLRNIGNAALVVGSPSITGANAADFSQLNTCGNSSVVPGAVCTFSVEYIPSTYLSENATLTIPSNAVGSPLVISLSAGPAPAPAVSLSASSINFSTVQLTQTQTNNLVVTNTGAANLHISKLTFSNPLFSATNSCSVIAPSAPCTIVVSFSPNALGQATGTLSIVSDSLSSPDVVSLQGTGVPETFTIIADQSGTGTGTVLLNGSTTLSAQEVAGATVVVVATPAVGSMFTSWSPSGVTTQTYSFTMPSNSLTVTAHFTKTINNVSASVPSLAFPVTNVGAASAAQTITITSGANVPVNGFSFAIGSGFQQTNNCTTLAVGATCTVNVVFDPTSQQQNYTTALTVTSSANTLIIPVTASATESPIITTQPASLTVLAPASATFTVAANCVPACTYQWFASNAPLTGATSSTYTLPQTQIASSGGTYFVVVSNGTASVQSSTATLTVNAVPVFTLQPASVNTNGGTTANFIVTASGNPVPAFVWSQNGVPIVNGPTGNQLSLNQVTKAVSGETITVTATNSVGQAKSNPAILTVNCNGAGTVSVSSAAGLTVPSGTAVVFNASVTGGTFPFTYQWLVNEQIVSGQTGPSLSWTVTGNMDVAVAATNSFCGELSSYSPTLQITTSGVVAPQIKSLTFASAQLSTGSDIGTVTLTNANSTTPVTVALSASPILTINIPSTVIVPAGQSTATFAATAAGTASGTVTVTAQLGSGTVSAVVNVSGNPNSVTLTPTTATVTAGQSATSQLFTTISGAAYTCSDTASKSTCSVSGNTLTITTTAASTSTTAGFTGIFGLLGAALWLCLMPKRRKLVRALALAAILVIGFGGVGCAGGSSGGAPTPTPTTIPGTPSGSYNIVVTATAGTSTANATFVLVVK